MRRHIARHTGISVDQPRATDIPVRFIDRVLRQWTFPPIDASLSQLMLVLQLVRESHPCHGGANGDDSEAARRRAQGFLVEWDP